MKPLDSINHRGTALVALALFAALFNNPAFTNALVTMLTHPTPQTIVGLLTALAGVAALYVAKPVGVSSAQPEPQGPQQNPTPQERSP